MVIRMSVEADFAAMLAIVNDAARAYRGVIPADRWHEPYMSADELAREIAEGVVFRVAEQAGRLAGVMGIQDKGEVALVRHAYVAPATQRAGVGRNGFTVVPSGHKDRLLRTYWSIPARQVETSVVLANGRWIKAQSALAGGPSGRTR